MTVKLKRRALLRGIAGAALALPMLDIMLDRHGTAYADGTPLPKRFVVCFGGHSLGFGYNDPQKPLYTHKEPRDLFVPEITGAYDPSLPSLLALNPIADLGVTNLISVVSGLRIPWSEGTGEAPPGGMPPSFHGYMLPPLLTGNRSTFGAIGFYGPSSDEIVRKAIAGDTPIGRLALAVQPAEYVYDNPKTGSISYAQDGSAIAPISSPSLAFTEVMGKIKPTTPAELAKRDAYIRESRSVLDLVSADAARLSAKLGTNDRRRLEEHFDHVRDLEQNLDKFREGCVALPIPKDPAVGGVVFTSDNVIADHAVNGWSDEETRAKLMVEVVALALKCDITRVASIAITSPQSFMSLYPIANLRCDVHGASHFGTDTTDGGSTHNMSLGIKWHVKHFASLVAKLGDIIDHCALVYCCEGGIGQSLEDPAGQPNAHSVENMACLIAGKAGGLVPGQHVNAAGKHPAQVLASAMKAVGAGETLGQVTGAIPALFGG